MLAQPPRTFRAVAFALVMGLAGGALADGDTRWRSLDVEDGLEMFAAPGAALPTFKAEGVLAVETAELLSVVDGERGTARVPAARSP